MRVEGGALIVELTNGEEIDCGAVSACTHRFSDWETVLEPTYTSVGYSRRTCADCGYTEYEFSEALGHDIRFYQPLQSPSAHSGSCERCGVYVQQRHTFEEGVCTVCEWSEAEIGDFSVCEWIETEIGDFSVLEPVISEIYPGASVTLIEDNAFSGCLNQTSIFPETVTNIGSYAFSDCSNLTSVVFRSVEPPEIGENVFGVAWDSPEFCVYVPAGSLEAYESVDDSLWQTHLVEAGKIKEM